MTGSRLAVRLETGDPGPELEALARQARDLAGAGAQAALGWATEAGDALPRPGRGATAHLWSALATVAAQDLAVARVLEPHVDALAILDEAGAEHRPGRTYGVWAAEGAEPRLTADQAGPGEWTLRGRKPWCSLAGEVSHALLTAWIDEGHRGLFLLDARDPRVSVEAGVWSPYALRDVVTATVAADGAAAVPVGGPGWYLARDGFTWGGMGVAAVWYGGAVALARRLLSPSRGREPDQVALVHLGAVDAALTAARELLLTTAQRVDAGRVGGADGALAAARVRQVVADAVEVVLTRVGHALGPAPLAHDAEHAQRVADLTLYVRQHHAERDQAALGRQLLAGPAADGRSPW